MAADRQNRLLNPSRLLTLICIGFVGLAGTLFGSPENLNAQITFSNGGSRSAIPQFGGYDPGSAGRFGFRTPNFGLGLTLGQGSTRSSTLNGIGVTIPNGGTGSFFSGTVNHFVTGINPIVGGGQFGFRGPYRNPYNYGPYNYGPYFYGPYRNFGCGSCGCSPCCCGGHFFGRPIAYGIQSAPFIAPGSVWYNYSTGPNYNYGRQLPQVTQRPVSRLTSLLRQNAGRNGTIQLPPPGSSKSSSDAASSVDLSKRIPLASRNSTADKAVKSLAEIRKEMKARKEAEEKFRKDEIGQLMLRSQKLLEQDKKSLALKYAKRAYGKVRRSEGDLKKKIANYIKKIENGDLKKK